MYKKVIALLILTIFSEPLIAQRRGRNIKHQSTKGKRRSATQKIEETPIITENTTNIADNKNTPTETTNTTITPPNRHKYKICQI